MPLRVALLSREYPPEVYGGAGVHVELLAEALSALVEVEVHCFGKPRTAPLVAGAYEPWEALAGDLPHLSALRTMSADLLMTTGVAGVDLVHSHTWYANLAGHLAKLCYRVPHVVTSHSLEPLRPWKAEQLGGGYALSSFCERTAIEAADAVIAVSRHMRADILRSYPALDPDRVEVIHNGIDPQAYQPDPGTDECERIGMALDRPAVVFVGRITRQKGIAHLLDAAPSLHPDAQLVLLAGAPDTADLMREVHTRVEALQASGIDIVWVPQMLDRSSVIQVLSHARAFVCPSIYEPFGLVNVEAMACSAPVVAAAVGGIPEVVVDGETGLLVPFERGDDPYGSPADPARYASDLAAAVNRLVADPELAAAMGAAGRQRVLDEFSWSRVAFRTADLYERLAKR